ncbi:hypothetical protein J437_LFUL011223 [Ladona fulva]|uniref:Uncharacterized protein n=1 Tax=Ladona fulva TaxID=123851 RepID=A0A8K0KDE3_LADFU|nr:hypothetical protein J437_LFUL011223 [Ladona fulva]
MQGVYLGGSLGLSICRTPQHPYPWVSSVTKGGAAEEAGLAPGDYLLHINNTPLLGLSVNSVATVVREADGVIEVIYWRPEGEDASLTSMLCIQRLVPKMDDILTAITCPICFEVPGIAIQCTNGHLLCLACRRRSFKCPICRTPLRTPSGIPLGGRNLLAEQLRSSLLGSATSHEAETKPKPTSETNNEPPSQQKQKKDHIICTVKY